MLKLEWDKKDLRILEILQEQARISNSDLAQHVGLSPSPCWRRVRALEDAGVIQQYVALVSAKSVGLPINVFATVTLEKQIESALEAFEKSVAERPEVMECYLMTGRQDFLLRVVVASLEDYDHFLKTRLTRLDGVASIESSFALAQEKYTSALPLRDG